MISLKLSLKLLLVSTPLIHALPSFLTCDRNLQIGEVIMTFPVAPSVNAPANQRHTVSLTDATGASVCGSTVNQGEEYTIQVDSNLVTADGPNYIVESTNSFLQTDADDGFEVACTNTRIVNPGEFTAVFPLQPGEMFVRLLSAYQFGQVYAAEECTVTVTASRAIALHDGYLVDNDSWESSSDALSSMPYSLTVEQLLAGSLSGYSVLMVNDSGDSFSLKYVIDDADANQDITELLQSLNATDINATDIQISIAGFESEDGTAIENVLSISQCASSTTCEGFYRIPTDQVCISDGVCIESSVYNEEENLLTTTIVTSDDSWFGIGFSTPGGGMNGGGSGSDMFVCSDEGLGRFLVTVKDNPRETGQVLQEIEEDAEDDEVIQNICILDAEAGTGRMTFTRTLDEGPRPITPGEAQAIIWARGPIGEQALANKHPANRRGEVLLDLTNLSGGLSETKTTVVWILWCHIVCMSLSWGLLLPLAVILANRTRQIGPIGRWFKYHKHLARTGWTFQTVGLICGIFYCEIYSRHFGYFHTIFGVIIAIAGFLQPVSAVMRPHPPKDGWVNGKSAGRIAFEVYHKGVGWSATVCGMVNVFLGATLALNINLQDAAAYLPMAIGGVGIALVAVVVIMSLVQKKRED